MTRFQDFDKASQQKMIKDKRERIARQEKKIKELQQDILEENMEAITWIDLAQTQEEMDKLLEQTQNNIKELQMELYARVQMIKEIDRTEPHELKSMYVLSSFKKTFE
jgi:predicted amino acid-binding ACT domain protein